MKLAQEYLYHIALMRIEKIGPVKTLELVQKFGSAKSVFAQDLKELGALHKELGELKQIDRALRQAEGEIEFIEKHGVRLIAFDSSEYPYRLKECPDAPLLLYALGDHTLTARRMVSVVGTRNCSSYGKAVTQNLIKELKEYDVTVVSGLAHGIDSVAHRSCVKEDVPTIGVLAHGLDKMYPVGNRKLAAQMVKDGALVTEFPTSAIVERENFPRRNRIVAGLSDVTIVVESKDKGGSLITASIATDYNREVMAYPGRSTDSTSEGTNRLIRTQRAHLITSGHHVAELMGWQVAKHIGPESKETIFEGVQNDIITALRNAGRTHVDSMALSLNTNAGELSTHLLDLELNGHILNASGGYYELTR